MTPTRWFLEADDDGQWYLVPEVRREQFHSWVQENTGWPEWVIPLDGPTCTVTFEQPLIDGKVIP